MPARLDIHAHLIPGIDDGCADLDESLDAVATLRRHGYAGTVCTPHIWPELFPGNTPSHIVGLTTLLQQELDRHEVGYRLWPGGELRLFKHAIKWLKQHGVPTLADTRYVLCDLWEDRWPKHADQTLDYLLDEGYTPILAHPERMNVTRGFEDHLDRIRGKGVLLQGNFNCFTGLEGPLAADRVRQYLRDGRYALMAMDLHRPDTLPARLEGLAMMADEFGAEAVERYTAQAPRDLLGVEA